MKNKKKVIIFAAAAAVCIILYIFSSVVKKRTPATIQEPATETTVQQETGDAFAILSGWEDDGGAQAPAVDTVLADGSAAAMEERYVSSLSRYPAPSYVSENEDSLIFRNGIYRRVGFVEEPKPANDTVIIDGRAYVPAGK